MARQEQIRLVDDLDGSPAATTVPFGLDGKSYELDLTDVHAADLRAMFAPYVDAGRRSGTDGQRSPRRSTTAVHSSAADNAAIRAWAQQHGLSVSRRGRIPDHVRRAYAERSAITSRLEPELQQSEPPSGYQARTLPPITDPFIVTAAS